MISVLMPVYNAEAFLQESVGSILSQTFTEFELLICDDGSTDNSYAVLSNIKDPRIRLFRNEQNLGNLKTCNFLISQAQGRYITLQDADDYSRADRLALQMELIRSQNLDMVGSYIDLVNLDGSVVRTLTYPLIDEEIRANLEKESVPPFCWATILFKREIYEQIDFFDERFNRINAADYDWIYRASEQSKMGNIDSPLYSYRLNPQGISKADNIINPLTLYSEDLARDLYKFRKNNKLIDDAAFFEERCTHYKSLFEYDKSRLFNKMVYRLAISEQRWVLMQQFFIILCAKSPFKYKRSALFAALIFIGIGYKGAQRIKALMK
jgi:glycosyltransferase involved in cell wall biosynthesis